MGPCIPNIRIPGPIGSVDSALNTHDGLSHKIALRADGRTCRS